MDFGADSDQDITLPVAEVRFVTVSGDRGMPAETPDQSPSLEEAKTLRASGRAIPGLTVMVGRAPPCALCHEEALTTGNARNGQTGIPMCPAHYQERGVGIGPGKGEVLIPTGAAPLPPPPVPAQPVGYSFLIGHFALSVMPPHRLTYLAKSGQKRERVEDGMTVVVLPPGGYTGGPDLIDHLEFALKREGVNLEVLAGVFRRADQATFEASLAHAIRERPTGRYTRVLWFLYEHLTGRRLEVPDAEMGNYVPVLDPDEYFASSGERSRRHRVLNNLLGTPSFCPLIRKSEKLSKFVAMNLKDEAARLVREYDEDALKRAISYLYTKETRSSFGIEGEHPSTSRTERFVTMLRSLPRIPRLDKAQLIALQNQTVDPRFANADYRDDQVYVGENIDLTRQHIHYIPPRPEDVPAMMDGLIAILGKAREATIDPVVLAAAASFGFVFIHPFSDGNGRLHRALIHYILSVMGFSPDGVIFPVSAVMLQRRRDYDECLESFSAPLMERVDYDESEAGIISVKNDTAAYYRFFDATRMAEALYDWVAETIRTEFRHELQFVVAFREARKAIEQIVEMPDKLANLFIKLVVQNRGKLSAAKRATQFQNLKDDEIVRMEEAVQEKLSAVIDHQEGASGS